MSLSLKVFLKIIFVMLRIEFTNLCMLHSFFTTQLHLWPMVLGEETLVWLRLALYTHLAQATYHTSLNIRIPCAHHHF